MKSTVSYSTSQFMVLHQLESRGDIIPRPSLLEPCVPVSMHTAPDILKG
ncbi:hypothetical protein [Nostoc sp.]